MIRRIVSFGTSIGIVLALLSSCVGNPLLPNEIRFSHQELSERMAKRFPLEKNIAGLLEIKLTRPIVGAREEIGKITRLGFTFDAEVKLALSHKTLFGTVILSGIPRYNPIQHAIFLNDAELDIVRTDNMPDGLSAALAKAASGIAKDYLDGKAIYSFKEEDLKRYGLALEPHRIEVQRHGIVLVMR